MSDHRYTATLDELTKKVGEELGVSNWVEVPQTCIDTFANVTGDTYFIHTDPVRAADTSLGGTIAHGFLTLSLLPAMIDEAIGWPPASMTVNYGIEKLRFLSPVKSGKRVRGRFVLAELTERAPGQWRQAMDVTVEIEGEDRPALVMQWVFLHNARTGSLLN